MVTMSINDLQNINNIRQTSHYIRVNTPQTEKKMTEEQNLFDSSVSYQNQSSFLLFPGSNEYDDEETANQKNNNSFFL